MSIATCCSSFLNPSSTTKPLHSFRHPITTTTTTLTISPPLRLRYKKPFLFKPHAALLPIPPLNFLPSSPIKPSISAALAILFDVSKTIAEKLIVSAHEFKAPLLALANAVGKWVDLYHSVLIVRILLSWFPNMPWEKQPFSAIRDLCDPCLSFFRTIMPPNTNNYNIDLSPLLAFVFFGVLSSFLKTSAQSPPI